MSLPHLPFDTSCCLIGGEWRNSVSLEKLELKNPSDGSILAEIASGNEDDIDDAITSAKYAFDQCWSTTPAAERGRILSNLGRLILKNIDLLSTLEALDVGKPFTQAQADVRALARYMEFYGGAADKVHGETIPYLEGYTVYTLREPHGVTGHIVPWNYPMQIIGPVSYTHLRAHET